MVRKLLELTIKDWLIIVTLLILSVCIHQIRKLKKTVTREVRSRLIPQLILEIDASQKTLILKNESYFLAKDINIEDLLIPLEDFGFKKNITLKFNQVFYLRPKESIKLQFKAFDKNQELPPDLVEKIIFHLVYANFKAKLLYSNIENIQFSCVLTKRKDKTYIEKIEPLDNAEINNK